MFFHADGPRRIAHKMRFWVFRCIYAPGSSTPASPSGSSPRLRPHRAPVHPELTSHGVHADALCAGCSHSVHFLVGQACSRSFLWFRRRADQRVVGLAVGLCIRANPLIPRGNQPLDPRSPVPTTLHCFHRRIDVQTACGDLGQCPSAIESRTGVGADARVLTTDSGTAEAS